MSILTVTSTNPNLSYILSKNPTTILAEKKPFERELRKGRVYGWFTKPDNTEFRLMFLDSPIDNSFGANSDFEYLDVSRYSNPYIPIGMIKAALDSAATKEHEMDTGDFKTTVSFRIQSPPGILFRFSQAAGMDITYNVISSNHFKVEVREDTVIKALNTAIIICVIACLADEDTYVPLPEAGITKYLNTLNRAQAPYYLRHLFISRAISNRSLFNKLLPQIQTGGMSFQFGNTQVQRHDAIKQALFSPTSVLAGESLMDIGCGDLYHSLKLADRYETVLAYDGDEDLCAKSTARLAKKQILNVSVFNTEVDAAWVLENKELFEGKDVLLSEVLEHREKPVSIELLKALLRTEASNIVLTVPNKDFNEFYNIGPDEFRHPDHKWEPTRLEFEELMSNLNEEGIGRWGCKVEYVGDTITREGLVIPMCLLASFYRCRI